MAVCIIDPLEVVHIEKEHIGAAQINAGEKKIVAGAIVCPGQFIMGRLEIQVLKAASVHIVHFVIGARQISEFICPGLRNRAVRLNALHGVQNGMDTETGGQPYHKEHDENLKNDDKTHKTHLIAERFQRRSVRVIGHLLQLVQAGPHIFPNMLLLCIIFVVVNHHRGTKHFFFPGKGRIFIRKLNRMKQIRIVGISLRLNHQPHGIVFPVHQADRTRHRSLQLLQSGIRAGSGLHSCNRLFPVIGLKRLFEVFFEIAHIAEDSKALYLLGQIIRGVHQLTGGLSQLDLLLGGLGQLPEAGGQLIGRIKHQAGDDRRPDDQPQMYRPKGDAFALIWIRFHRSIPYLLSLQSWHRKDI